jgi:hypothetical protein
MDTPFEGARLKIKRANHHIADIKSRVRSLIDAYTVTIEKNTKTGHESVRYGLPDDDISIQIALVTGDAIHNLKTALDYAWREVLTKFVPAAVDNFAKFPVRKSRDDLEGALNGRKINVAAPNLFALIVSSIKSYKGGNDSLWAIHQLDIIDKHRLLLPVMNYTALQSIELENDAGEIIKGGTWATTQSTFFADIPSGYHIKDKGQVAVTVIFGKGTPVDGMDVSDMLSTFAIVVLNIIELLDSF